MALAKRITELREKAGLTIDELAKKATISKTYMWELEKDEAGAKKPSADVLLESPERTSDDDCRIAFPAHGESSEHKRGNSAGTFAAANTPEDSRLTLVRARSP